MTRQIDIHDPQSIPLPDEEIIPTPTSIQQSFNIPAPCDIPPPPSPTPLPEEVPLPDESPFYSLDQASTFSSSGSTLKPTSSSSSSQKITSSETTYHGGDQNRGRRRRKNDSKHEEGSDLVGREENEMMAKMLGFSDFNSTKGKQVPGNQVGAVHVVKKRRYRQYMNRRGGFNRPLDRVA